MACKISSSNLPPRPLHRPAAGDTLTRPRSLSPPLKCAASAITRRGGGGPDAAVPTSPTVGSQRGGLCGVEFQTLRDCKLGISWYPDFDYDASGGAGTATGKAEGGQLSVCFDVGTLYIPPLTTATTRFLGLPLPPFLKIEIVPELFRGLINRETGQVDLDFRARFCFSVGSIYRARPLMVETRLTSEESKGSVRGGRGRRLDGEGRCRLVGVAKVEPINDVLLDSFLGLPNECIARLSASISVSDSSQYNCEEQN